MHPTHEPNSTLLRFFAGLAEYAFESRLGVVDPPLVDYLSLLLTRFVTSDSIYALRDLEGKRLEEVTEMLIEGQARVGEARREAHRHVGDFTLFWTGVYPEALPRLRGSQRADQLIDYSQQGKRAYFIASTIPSGESENGQADVLARLSVQFELCQYGLGEIRREWERRDEEGDSPRPMLLG